MMGSLISAGFILVLIVIAVMVLLYFVPVGFGYRLLRRTLR